MFEEVSGGGGGAFGFNAILTKMSAETCPGFFCLSFFDLRLLMTSLIFRSRNRLVVGLKTTYAISAYHHYSCEVKFRSWREQVNFQNWTCSVYFGYKDCVQIQNIWPRITTNLPFHKTTKILQWFNGMANCQRISQINTNLYSRQGSLYSKKFQKDSSSRT
jgi:hypothetical protein